MDLCVVSPDEEDIKSGTYDINHYVDFHETADVLATKQSCWKFVETSNPDKDLELILCDYNSATLICRQYGGLGTNRFINADEVRRIYASSGYPSSLGYFSSEHLNMCEQASLSALPRCQTTSFECMSSGSAECNPYSIFIKGEHTLFDYMFFHHGVFYTSIKDVGTFSPWFTESIVNFAGQVRCAYELSDWYQYSGAGGASGAKFTKTINVLPFDTLEFTIGTGGTGGGANTNGSQGSTTQVVHKRGSTIMGTYYVKGGLGGNKATNSASGLAHANGTESGQTTQSGTCYAQARQNPSGSLVGGNTACSVLSFSGESGTTLKGGNGGAVNNSGVQALGGEIDSGSSGNGIGYSASVHGFGGGGGTCARGIRNPSKCSKGGNGAQGVVDISYRIALPGAGGGSATRVGGSKTISGEDKQYEIKYKVTEGSRVVVKIGAGGSGGVAGQDGTNGEPTIVGDNKILFLGGQGATAVTQTQKNNLSNCIGTSTNQYTILGCIDNASYKSTGGQSGVVGDEDAIKSTTSGLIISSDTTSNVDYSIQNTSYKGQAGWIGSYMVTGFSTPLSYGFHGGSGGTPFGIRDLIPSVTCGGGMSAKYPATGGVATNYICTSGTANANRSKAHDPVNNEFGGSGGGGGGVTDTTSDGEGSAGTSGYLRIRWNEAEQE